MEAAAQEAAAREEAAARAAAKAAAAHAATALPSHKRGSLFDDSDDEPLVDGHGNASPVLSTQVQSTQLKSSPVDAPVGALEQDQGMGLFGASQPSSKLAARPAGGSSLFAEEVGGSSLLGQDAVAGDGRARWALGSAGSVPTPKHVAEPTLPQVKSSQAKPSREDEAVVARARAAVAKAGAAKEVEQKAAAAQAAAKAKVFNSLFREDTDDEPAARSKSGGLFGSPGKKGGLFDDEDDEGGGGLFGRPARPTANKGLFD